MKKQYPAFIDNTAELFDSISISAGQRGIQIIIHPNDLLHIAKAELADLI
ncbi:MAG: hypothetical protein GYA14_16905 [Ignavibacteria bacterium]|nr:hypothetical protein [Ignavibacteria bacterium]